MWQLLMTGNFQLGPAVIWEVVGLIANERMSSFDDKESSPGIYVTNEQCPTATQHVLVREETDSSSLPESLRRTRAPIMRPPRTEQSVLTASCPRNQLFNR